MGLYKVESNSKKILFDSEVCYGNGRSNNGLQWCVFMLSFKF